ncbi:leukotriene B4 receptor 1-like [Pelobates fuscus]|uniref:leukotriene B4 receptor 1-like n=1 Tax=Pelobates fuscus TaxID=191477 RepID=UPI002FE458D1
MMTETNTVSDMVTSLNYSLVNSTELTVLPSGSFLSVGIAILSVAFIIGLPGNAFIIWTVLTQIMKPNVTCTFILHLAVADTMVILTGPIFIHLLATGSWMFGSIICKLCHYIGILSMFASVFIITFMSLDRFLAVAMPFATKTMRTKIHIKTLVLAIWLLASVLAIPSLFFRSLKMNGNRLQCMLSHNNSAHILFQYLFETLFGFLIPFPIIVFSYLYICIRLRSAQFNKKHKASGLVILIVVTFALFWIPFHIVNILQILGVTTPNPITAQKFNMAVRLARPNVTALVFLSSSINPLLYTLAGGSFIRTAGISFMAKLFEGTSPEVSTFQKVTQVFRQKNKSDSVDLVKLGEHKSKHSIAIRQINGDSDENLTITRSCKENIELP